MKIMLAILALALPGCVVKLDIGQDARYGRAVIGYELPDFDTAK